MVTLITVAAIITILVVIKLFKRKKESICEIHMIPQDIINQNNIEIETYYKKITYEQYKKLNIEAYGTCGMIYSYKYIIFMKRDLCDYYINENHHLYFGEDYYKMSVDKARKECEKESIETLKEFLK